MAEQSIDAIEAVLLRNNFYKSNYRIVCMAFFIGLAIITIALGTVIYALNCPPSPVYFAITADGKIMPIVPLGQPNLSQAELLQWAAEAATGAFTYNYASWRSQLQELSESFTPAGWKDFIATLAASNNLEAVKAKKLMVNATTIGPVSLLRQGLFNGRYAWKIQVPILVTYQGGNNQFTQQALNVTMVIARLPTLTSNRGVAITQLIAAEMES